MSAPAPVQKFMLFVDQDPASTRVSVQDVTAGGAPVTLAERAELPVFLSVGPGGDAQPPLVVRVAAGAFDPGVTRDADVLAVETSITDAVFGTQDDTRYVVHLTNRSRYYVAEDVRVTAELTPEARAATRLPDDNLSLSLSPREQHVACIGPGCTADLAFSAISRGPPPGLYPVRISLQYRLLYWDGRTARAVSEQVLPVQSPHWRPHVPTNTPAVPRSNTVMPETNPINFFPAAKAPEAVRELRPIDLQVPLPGGGHLEVSYRLTKNNHPDPAHAPGCYGINPNTRTVESYFSTQDTAALEVTLRNASPHDLKHVRLGGVRLVPFVEGDRPEGAPEPKLPDGNLLFEVIPNEMYYGHISAGEREVKYLSLITRGVAPGRYSVHMTTHYDIEQCKVPINLWLQVNPD